MKFKYPGFDVAIVTAIWIAILPLGIMVGFSLGYFPWYVYAGMFTGLCAVGMWFQIKTAGYVFAGVNILLSIVGILGIVLGGFSGKVLVQTVFKIYSAVVAIGWVRDS